ncbi:UNVERIFIED_CONTAM: hypothetical protein PYX00_010177 [Menopon gallinae]|uniref:NADH dehydrogenase [ubiquinone] 1 alpha subcomplex subunit 12 n=1 Tax=Menopon gallinae TaxID=328185 RepID=A0AAW2HED0_9NEOP
MGIRALKNLIRIIRYHGGLYRTLERLYLADTTKIGHFVGQDQFGNRYYENNYFFFARNRWVIYTRKVGVDYEATQISSEYFNWMHHITDIPPDRDPDRKRYHWMLPHTENQTGTNNIYVPYSTVNAKIQPWVPCKASKTVPPSGDSQCCQLSKPCF